MCILLALIVFKFYLAKLITQQHSDHLKTKQTDELMSPDSQSSDLL